MKYRITVRALQGNILTYSVNSYDIEKGYIVFVDRKTNKKKRFHSSNTEIEESELNE